MSDETKRLRYPGINSFSEKDHDIFCGRSNDATTLLNRVTLNNTVVLHGESGAGKTSLVQAGLLPILDSYNEYLEEIGKCLYKPFVIRFDSILEVTSAGKTKEDLAIDTLVEQTLKVIHKKSTYEKTTIPFIDSKQNNLWYTAKQFERNGQALLLIFDQFEIIQNYSWRQVKNFAAKLSQIFMSPMPQDLYKEYDRNVKALAAGREMTSQEKEEYDRDISFMEGSLSARILFVVREDKLGTMSMLVDYFPDILKNDFFLLPLNEKEARRSIEEPALIEGEGFEYPKFEFDPAAVDHLLQALRDENTMLYDPIQLQVVCSTIEKMVKPNKLVIKKTDIPKIGDIISDFYINAWKSIKTEFKLADQVFEQKKVRIISELVVSGKRNLVLENLLVTHNDTQDLQILDSLVRQGLLRRMPAGKDTFYQLCHDRLIVPLSKDLQDVQAREEVKKQARTRRVAFLWGAAILLGIAAGVAVVFYLKARDAERESEEQKYQLVSVSLKRSGNPTLAYLIGKDFEKRHPNSKLLSDYLRSFDTSQFAYLQGIYPSLSKVVSADIRAGDSLIIKEYSYNSVWDLRSATFVKRLKVAFRNPDLQFATTDRKLEIFKTGTLASIRDNKTDTMRTFPMGHSNVALSPDSRYIIVGSSIVSSGNKKISQLIPGTGTNQKKIGGIEQNAVVFISKDRFAVGYSDGKIVIFGIPNGDIAKVKRIDSMSLFGLDYTTNNYGVTGLLYDSSLSYLMAANTRNGIDIFDLSRVGSFTLSTVNDYRYVTELRGHTGSITCMTLSPDGKTLLSGSSDNSAILWDINSKKRLSILKTDNSTSISQVNFTDNSRIITISDNNIVYVWNWTKPSVLYDNDQLYRFSPVNYMVWGLDKRKEVSGHDDLSATTGLFKETLNYLLNMPSAAAYPDDKTYNDSLASAEHTIKNLYQLLGLRKDYHDRITDINDALLDKLYYINLLSEPDLLNGNRQDKEAKSPILLAKGQIPLWKLFFLDTTYKNAGIAIWKNFSIKADAYIEIQKKYEDGLRYINFYDDSVFKPLTAGRGSNSTILDIRNRIDVFRLKCYLYTGRSDRALEIARRLADSTIRSIDGEIYLISTYLVMGQSDKADELYNRSTRNKSQLEKNLLTSDLQDLLLDIRGKNIGEPGISNFLRGKDLDPSVGP